jgi:hypothetical protein
MNKILESLMALLPEVEAGSTKVIELATAVKSEAQAAGIWTETHESALQTAVAVVNPVTASQPPRPTGGT